MSGPTVTSEIPLDAVLRSGVRRILASRHGSTGINMAADADITVSTGQAARIMGVLREAILNSIDYAHPSGVPGKISLSSARQPDGTVKLKVADDGVGLPEGFDPAHDGGEGFRTMRRASAELGAVLSVRSKWSGLEVSLILPRPLAREMS